MRKAGGLGGDGDASGAGAGRTAQGGVFSRVAEGKDAYAEDVGMEGVDAQGEGGGGDLEAGGAVGVCGDLRARRGDRRSVRGRDEWRG